MLEAAGVGSIARHRLLRYSGDNMKVSESTIEMGSLLISSEQLQPRLPGVHVSDVIKHIVKVGGLRKTEGYTDDDLAEFGIFGRVWEHHLALTLFQPPRYERVGVVELDGILGSPDAVDFDEYAVAEFKMAWASCSEIDKATDKAAALKSKFPWYIWQIASYCHMLSMVRARLVVAFVNGNYKPPKPCTRQYSIIFTAAELTQHWRNLVLPTAEKLGGISCG